MSNLIDNQMGVFTIGVEKKNDLLFLKYKGQFWIFVYLTCL
jgi:hypothetical protein